MDEAAEVVWMVRGAWVSLCLRAMCELGIVDALEEPRSLADLADRTSTDPTALARLLRVLVDLDLLSLDDDRYAATPRGGVLRLGHPSGVRNLALMQTVLPNLTTWQHLADAVRSGGGVYEDLIGSTSWEWLAAHPEEQAVFNAAMARRGTLQVAAIHAALDQLALQHREVLVLREFEGLSYEEIAKLLDVPRGTIESRLHRARARLRAALPAVEESHE